MKTENETEIFTTMDMAKMLKISSAKVVQLVEGGDIIAPEMIGKRRRWHGPAVRLWLDSWHIASATEGATNETPGPD